jgi:hypothetical protein
MRQRNGCRVTSSQTFGGDAQSTTRVIDEYCAEYKDLFKEVRSMESRTRMEECAK